MSSYAYQTHCGPVHQMIAHPHSTFEISLFGCNQCTQMTFKNRQQFSEWHASQFWCHHTNPTLAELDAPTETTPEGGRHSALGADYTQLDPEAIRAVAETLFVGSDKYGVDNWRAISVKDHLNHVLFHVFKYLEDGQEVHLRHAATRAIFALAVHIRPEFRGAWEAKTPDFWRSDPDAQ